MITFYESIQQNNIEIVKTYNLDWIPTYIINNGFRLACENKSTEIVKYLISKTIFSDKSTYYLLENLWSDDILLYIISTKRIIKVSSFLYYIQSLTLYKHILTIYPETILTCKNILHILKYDDYELYKYVISKINMLEVEYSMFIEYKYTKNLDIIKDIFKHLERINSNNIIILYIDEPVILEYLLSLNWHNITVELLDYIFLYYNTPVKSLHILLDYYLVQNGVVNYIENKMENLVITKIIYQLIKTSDTLVDCEKYRQFINLDVSKNYILQCKNLDLVKYLHKKLDRHFIYSELCIASKTQSLDVFKYVYYNSINKSFNLNILCNIYVTLPILQFMLDNHRNVRLDISGFSQLFCQACYIRNYCDPDCFKILDTLYSYTKIYSYDDRTAIITHAIENCIRYEYDKSVKYLLDIHYTDNLYYKKIYKKFLNVIDYSDVDSAFFKSLIDRCGVNKITHHDLEIICTELNLEILQCCLENLEIDVDMVHFVNTSIINIVTSGNFSIAQYLISKYNPVHLYTSIALHLDKIPYTVFRQCDEPAYNIVYEILPHLNIDIRKKMLLNTRSYDLVKILLTFMDYEHDLYVSLIHNNLSNSRIICMILHRIAINNNIITDIVHKCCANYRSFTKCRQTLISLSKITNVTNIICKTISHRKLDIQIRICSELCISLELLVVNNFRKWNSIDGSSVICSICYEVPNIITKCSHHFCSSCLAQWLGKNMFCPYCRGVLF